MITLKELCAAIDGLGIPWANQKFDTDEPEPPFICLVAGFSEAAYADNLTYMQWMPYDVALYTRQRDYATEQRVAAALDEAGCAYTLGITNIDNEKLVEAAFSVNVAEKE